MGWQQQRMKSGYFTLWDFPWTKALFWHQNSTNSNYLCWVSVLAEQHKLSLNKVMTPSLSPGYYLCTFFQRFSAKVCASFFCAENIKSHSKSCNHLLHFFNSLHYYQLPSEDTFLLFKYAWSKIHNIHLIVNYNEFCLLLWRNLNVLLDPWRTWDLFNSLKNTFNIVLPPWYFLTSPNFKQDFWTDDMFQRTVTENDPLLLFGISDT